MRPIEQIPNGTLVFLRCGCAAMRGLTHPTGDAALVVIMRPCETHLGEAVQARSLPKGELVSPWTRPAE
jgi:hypothetical protein